MTLDEHVVVKSASLSKFLCRSDSQYGIYDKSGGVDPSMRKEEEEG